MGRIMIHNEEINQKTKDVPEGTKQVSLPSSGSSCSPSSKALSLKVVLETTLTPLLLPPLPRGTLAGGMDGALLRLPAAALQLPLLFLRLSRVT